MNFSNQLREQLYAKGASIIGYADLIGLPENNREFKRYAVSIAVALNPKSIKDITCGPTLEYYKEYKRVNELLVNLSDYACQLLTTNGFEAVSKAPTYVGIDPVTRSTILPHKTVATRAGIGWIGKCALLVTEKYGSAE